MYHVLLLSIVIFVGIFQNHQQICPYEVVQCPSSNCRVFLARNLIEEHVAVSCQWRIVSCQFCSEEYPKAEEHVSRLE